jgi:hypothetical protein
MADIKHISIKEFRERGYLQEANRRFFHPLGLALEVTVDDETGEETLSGVWDYREDPEGMVFAEGYGLDVTKADNVDNDIRAHEDARFKLFGAIVQPLEQS